MQSNRLWVDTLPGVAFVALIVGIAGVLGPAMQPSGPDDPSVRAGKELEAIARAFHAYHEQIGIWPSTGRYRPLEESSTSRFPRNMLNRC